MENKEIQLININPYDVAKEYRKMLENPDLPLIKRRTYETYLKNYKLRNMNMQEKQDSILKEHPKKQQKKQNLTPKKIIITAAFTALVATTGFTGFKVYQRNERIKVLNSYNRLYPVYEIKYGDTLTSIASSYYETFPEEVKQYLSLSQLIDEIKHCNHIKDIDYIKSGNNIIIPSYGAKASSSYNSKTEEEKYQK